MECSNVYTVVMFDGKVITYGGPSVSHGSITPDVCGDDGDIWTGVGLPASLGPNAREKLHFQHGPVMRHVIQDTIGFVVNIPGIGTPDDDLK